MDEKILQLKESEGSDNIVLFGGAGVSTESNIPDFRSVDGLYNLKYKYSPEVILSHTFYREHTSEFFEFYRDKMIFPDAKPNATHLALAKLEEMGKLKSVITQNIDGLHQLLEARMYLSFMETFTETIVKIVENSMVWSILKTARMFRSANVVEK